MFVSDSWNIRKSAVVIFGSVAENSSENLKSKSMFVCAFTVSICHLIAAIMPSSSSTLGRSWAHIFFTASKALLRRVGEVIELLENRIVGAALEILRQTLLEPRKVYGHAREKLCEFVVNLPGDKGALFFAELLKV